MRKLSAALLLFVFATTTRGEWVEQNSQSEPSAVSELEHRHLVLKNSVTGARATIELAVFSSKSLTVRIIDNGNAGNSLAEHMRDQHCLAGVNGGFFDSNFAPLGLLIADGVSFAPLQRGGLLTGILAISSRGVQISRVREFSAKERFDAAVQSGPFLVDRGRRVRGLEDSRVARRTFAAMEHDDRAALGCCSEISLAQLSALLATGVADFKTYRALNLDGGSSSAFWFKRKGGSVFSIPEQKLIRDFVGIVPEFRFPVLADPVE